MIDDPEFVRFTVCQHGRTLQLAGVYVIVTEQPPVLNVFTRHARSGAIALTEVDHVISLPMASVSWWSERDYNGPPYRADEPLVWR